MLSRPDSRAHNVMAYDEVALAKEHTELLGIPSEMLQSFNAVPGTELHKWKTVLANWGSLQSLGVDTLMTRANLPKQGSRRWCNEARLRCLIRGAKLNDGDECTNVQEIMRRSSWAWIKRRWMRRGAKAAMSTAGLHR